MKVKLGYQLNDRGDRLHRLARVTAGARTAASTFLSVFLVLTGLDGWMLAQTPATVHLPSRPAVLEMLPGTTSPNGGGLSVGGSNGLGLRLIADPNSTYAILASSDFQNWIILATNRVPSTGYSDIRDLTAFVFDRRFYRAQLLSFPLQTSPAGPPADRRDCILVRPKPGLEMASARLLPTAQVLQTFRPVGNLQLGQVSPSQDVAVTIQHYVQSGLAGGRLDLYRALSGTNLPPPSAPPLGPIVRFKANPVSGSVPLTVQFTDQSTGSLAAWDWNFGDGSADVSTQSPSHTFTNARIYTVTLVVTSSDGTANSMSRIITATPPPPQPSGPVADFTVDPTSGPVPLTVRFTGEATGSISGWKWDFGDGSPASSTQSPSHTFANAGNFTVTLVVTSSDGTTNSESTIITATAPPPLVTGVGGSQGGFPVSRRQHRRAADRAVLAGRHGH